MTHYCRDVNAKGLFGAPEIRIVLGEEAVYQIREHAGFLRSNSVVGAVGASFDIETGINPLNLAR